MRELYNPTFKEQYDHLLGDDDSALWAVISDCLDKMILFSKDVVLVDRFYKVIAVCAVPLIVLCIVLFVRDGSMLYLGVLAMLSLFLIYKSVKLSGLVADVHKPSTDMAIEQEVGSKINYLESGMQTTRYRIETCLQLYLLFAPWILILSALFVYKPTSSIDWAVLVAVSYILSATLWYRLFRADLTTLEPLYGEVDQVKLAYYSLLQR